jgi:hypothetical protein
MWLAPQAIFLALQAGFLRAAGKLFQRPRQYIQRRWAEFSAPQAFF